MNAGIVDVQSSEDARGIELDCAGVSGLRYPIVVLDRALKKQATVASIEMSVSLPREFKGTHMSRFVELLEQRQTETTLTTLPTLLREMCARLNADKGQIEISFPYFIEKVAPVSAAKGLVDYECWFRASIDKGVVNLILGIRVPVTSLCPCSKAISDYGAHNQRGYVSIEVRPNIDEAGTVEQIWLEELVTIAEKSSSAPVYALLKRADERYVTMQAYDNPVFVEDMVRNVVAELDADKRLNWYRVRADNHESIHNHSAFAMRQSSKSG